MRPNYPVNSEEMKNELRTIQEHLVRIIGYDYYPHDELLEKEGSYDTNELALDASGAAMVDSRMYGEGHEPIYPMIFSANLRHNLFRRT
jgi:hypothetical protein